MNNKLAIGIILVLVLAGWFVFYSKPIVPESTLSEKTYSLNFAGIEVQKTISVNQNQHIEKYTIQENAEQLVFLNFVPSSLVSRVSALSFQGNQKQSVLLTKPIVVKSETDQGNLDYRIEYSSADRNGCSMAVLLPKTVFDELTQNELQEIVEEFAEFESIAWDCTKVNQSEERLNAKLSAEFGTKILLEQTPTTAMVFQPYEFEYSIGDENNYGIVQVTDDGVKHTETITFNPETHVPGTGLLILVPKSLAQKASDVQITGAGESTVVLDDPVIFTGDSPDDPFGTVEIKLAGGQNCLHSLFIYPLSNLEMAVRHRAELEQMVQNIENLNLSCNSANNNFGGYIADSIAAQVGQKVIPIESDRYTEAEFAQVMTTINEAVTEIRNGNTDFGEWGKKIEEKADECDRNATQDGLRDAGQAMSCTRKATEEAYWETSMYKKEVFTECGTPEPDRYWEKTVPEGIIADCLAFKLCPYCTDFNTCPQGGTQAACRQEILQEYKQWKAGNSGTIKATFEEERAQVETENPYLEIEFKAEDLTPRKQLQTNYALPQPLPIYFSEQAPEIEQEFLFTNPNTLPNLGNEWQSTAPSLESKQGIAQGMHVTVNGKIEPFRLKVWLDGTNYLPEQDRISTGDLLGTNTTVEAGINNVQVSRIVELQRYTLEDNDAVTDTLDFGALDFVLEKKGNIVEIKNVNITPELMSEPTRSNEMESTARKIELDNESLFSKNGTSYQSIQNIQLTQSQPFIVLTQNGKGLYWITWIPEENSLIVKRIFTRTTGREKIGFNETKTGKIILNYGLLFGGKQEIEINLGNNECLRKQKENGWTTDIVANCYAQESQQAFEEYQKINERARIDLSLFLQANKTSGLPELSTISSSSAFTEYIDYFQQENVRTQELPKEAFVWEMISQQDLLHKPECAFPEFTGKTFLGLKWTDLKQGTKLAEFYYNNCFAKTKLLKAQILGQKALDLEMKNLENNPTQNQQIWVLKLLQDLDSVDQEVKHLNEFYYGLEQMQAIAWNQLFPDALGFLEFSENSEFWNHLSSGTGVNKTKIAEFLNKAKTELNNALNESEQGYAKLIQKFDPVLEKLKQTKEVLPEVKEWVSVLQELRITQDLLDRDPQNIQLQQDAVRLELNLDLITIGLTAEDSEQTEMEKQAREKARQHLQALALDNAVKEVSEKLTFTKIRLAQLDQEQTETFTQYRKVYDWFYAIEELTGINENLQSIQGLRRKELVQMEIKLKLIQTSLAGQMNERNLNLSSAQTEIKTARLKQARDESKIPSGAYVLGGLVKYLDGVTQTFSNIEKPRNIARNFNTGEELFVTSHSTQTIGLETAEGMSESAGTYTSTVLLGKIKFTDTGIEFYNAVEQTDNGQSTGSIVFESSPVIIVSKTELSNSNQWIPNTATESILTHQIANLEIQVKLAGNTYFVQSAAVNDKCITTVCPFPERNLPEELAENNPILQKWIQVQTQWNQNQNLDKQKEGMLAFAQAKNMLKLSTDLGIEESGEFLTEYNPATLGIQTSELNEFYRNKGLAGNLVQAIEKHNTETEFARAFLDLRWNVIGIIAGEIVIMPAARLMGTAGKALLKTKIGTLGKELFVLARKGIQKGSTAFVDVTEVLLGKVLNAESLQTGKTIIAKASMNFLKGIQNTMEVLTYKTETVKRTRQVFWKKISTSVPFKLRLGKWAGKESEWAMYKIYADGELVRGIEADSIESAVIQITPEEVSRDLYIEVVGIGNKTQCAGPNVINITPAGAACSVVGILKNKLGEPIIALQADLGKRIVFEELAPNAATYRFVRHSSGKFIPTIVPVTGEGIEVAGADVLRLQNLRLARIADTAEVLHRQGMLSDQDYALIQAVKKLTDRMMEVNNIQPALHASTPGIEASWAAAKALNSEVEQQFLVITGTDSALQKTQAAMARPLEEIVQKLNALCQRGLQASPNCRIGSVIDEVETRNAAGENLLEIIKGFSTERRAELREALGSGETLELLHLKRYTKVMENLNIVEMDLRQAANLGSSFPEEGTAPQVLHAADFSFHSKVLADNQAQAAVSKITGIGTQAGKEVVFEFQGAGMIGGLLAGSKSNDFTVFQIEWDRVKVIYWNKQKVQEFDQQGIVPVQVRITEVFETKNVPNVNYLEIILPRDFAKTLYKNVSLQFTSGNQAQIKIQDRQLVIQINPFTTAVRIQVTDFA
ncbi:MAG: hypothetical protein Q7S92_07120 [Candidatus Diapherotrites archaeon]|nr:hypothetical protein [Candidatus Diapherotrites archaeon]